MSVSASSDSAAEATVLVLEDTHDFEASDGTRVWQIGFVPIDEDGDFLPEEDYRTSDPRCFFCHVAGVSYRRPALDAADISPGAPLRLARERDNPHDPNAIAVLAPAGEQLGYIPAELCPRLLATTPPGQAFEESYGAMVLSEFRTGAQSGERAGLRILIGPAGGLTLKVTTEDETNDTEEPAPQSISSLEAHAAATQNAPIHAGMTVVACPACGSEQEAFDDIAGFRCSACHQDTWKIRCRRCKRASTIFGSAAGTGALQFRCSHCRAKNTVDKRQLRGITTEVKRRTQAMAAARKQSAADAKAAKAQLLAEAQREAEDMNDDLEDQLSSLEGVLTSGIKAQAFSFSLLKADYEAPALDAGALGKVEAEPRQQDFLPTEPHGLSGLIPGAKARYQRELQAGEQAYAEATDAHRQRETQRAAQLQTAEAAHNANVAENENAERAQHATVDELDARFAAGDPAAVIEYMSAALADIPLPFQPPDAPRVAFSAESRQLVLQLALPAVEVIPAERGYRFIKARSEVSPNPMPASDRKRRYASLIAQIALLVIERTFACDPHEVIETVVLNGHLASIDKRTGHEINPCLVTVRTTEDRFRELDLTKVDPVECLKGLTASISRSPAELVPVRPIIDFDMADPRFVKEDDVLATLDNRPNLMELTPKEFEYLITNLFEKMGLDTRQTQASRDGGVDCVAYDSRPIFGGKVVIQAKRYKNTVGVSAVRDLFGTMQNEGATKGILVTTSGYGKASHEFASGKPLELIDGSGLLYLLNEHASIDAKIEVPEDWVDPEPPS
jgi:restriction system protein